MDIFCGENSKFCSLIRIFSLVEYIVCCYKFYIFDLYGLKKLFNKKNFVQQSSHWKKSNNLMAGHAWNIAKQKAPGIAAFGDKFRRNRDLLPKPKSQNLWYYSLPISVVAE